LCVRRNADAGRAGRGARGTPEGAAAEPRRRRGRCLHGPCIYAGVCAGVLEEEIMTAAWMVKDSNGQLLSDLTGASRLDVGRKLVPTRFDAFRFEVSSSYREMFERALSQVLDRNGWQIVRVRG
jgi:hypothetical protein